MSCKIPNDIIKYSDFLNVSRFIRFWISDHHMVTLLLPAVKVFFVLELTFANVLVQINHWQHSVLFSIEKLIDINILLSPKLPHQSVIRQECFLFSV